MKKIELKLNWGKEFNSKEVKRNVSKNYMNEL